jgi:hypothetical protein
MAGRRGGLTPKVRAIRTDADRLRRFSAPAQSHCGLTHLTDLTVAHRWSRKFIPAALGLVRPAVGLPSPGDLGDHLVTPAEVANER